MNNAFDQESLEKKKSTFDFYLNNLHMVIFSLQFVCVSGILVNKIPAERMHRFGRGFC